MSEVLVVLRSEPMAEPTDDRPGWTFLTNHAHVLVALYRDPELRQRDIADLVGITQGAVQRILDDLEHGGYLLRERVGRRNRYEVLTGTPMRHPLDRPHTIDEILDVLVDGAPTGPGADVDARRRGTSG